MSAFGEPASIPRMQEILTALGIDGDYGVTGEGSLPSRYAVTGLAVASVGAVGLALARLGQSFGLGARGPGIVVDRRLASLWFSRSIRPGGWKLPPVWNAIAGVYGTRDGWIRLHTNLAHHRAAALLVLDCAEEREAVAEAVSAWEADALEAAIVGEGGAAATLHRAEDWSAHPQGMAVASEPLVAWGSPGPAVRGNWKPEPGRPLKGLRVLDLTRVLAGPVATRTLAGFGADVLRIDPPGWEEPGAVPDVCLGKRCARLDLRAPPDRARFEALLAGADVLVHGYRNGALDGLGYGPEARARFSPGLIEVSLNAYGWTGPWARRRGFDSLVQMSSGIAEAGMRWKGADQPVPLPVQALDHATGYLMAASAIRLLEQSVSEGQAGSARLSLARTAELLKRYPQTGPAGLEKTPCEGDLSTGIETTPWGPARRLKPPLRIEGVPMAWDRLVSDLGTATPEWEAAQGAANAV